MTRNLTLALATGIFALSATAAQAQTGNNMGNNPDAANPPKQQGTPAKRLAPPSKTERAKR